MVRRQRQGRGSRRTGYMAAVVVNALMLYAVNVWPGWEALPFLTAETTLVLGWVNASLLVNAVANAAYVVRDPVWFKALGDAATTTVGLLALVRWWQVWPFDFGGSGWELLARILLVVAVVGSAIAIVANVVRCLRDLAAHGGHHPATT